jgi:hypothetical protein
MFIFHFIIFNLKIPRCLRRVLTWKVNVPSHIVSAHIRSSKYKSLELGFTIMNQTAPFKH